MALGDIVKSNQSKRPKNKKGGGRGRGRKNTRGGGRGGGRGSGRRGGYGGSRQGRTSYRQSPYQNNRRQGSQNNRRQGSQDNRRQGFQNNRGGSYHSDSAQISISNLNVQVTEADVREIFSGIGRIRNVAVHYDARGRSRGTAVVTFQTRGQAIKAVNEYHQAEVDGRPMYVRTVTGGGGGVDAPARKRSVKKKTQQQRRQRQSNKKRGNNNTRGRGKKGGRGRGGKRDSAPSKTAEQLDKEMEDYHNNVNSGVDAASAGQPSTARLFDGQPSADGAEE